MDNLEQVENKIHLPLIPTRGLLIFPGTFASFDMERKVGINALSNAVSSGMLVYAVLQFDPGKENPEEGDLCRAGVVCRIRQQLSLPDGTARVMLEGLYRAATVKVISSDDGMFAEVIATPDKVDRISKLKKEALYRDCVEVFSDYIHVLPQLSDEIVVNAYNISEPGRLSDYISQYLRCDVTKCQELISCIYPYKRIELLIRFLNEELDIYEIESQIHDTATGIMNDEQREYYLRSQIKAIRHQLGEDKEVDELESFRIRIEALEAPEEVKEKLKTELGYLRKYGFSSPDAAHLRAYMDMSLSVPWGNRSDEEINLDKARKTLDKDHYGLDKVKERIIEYLAVKKLAPDVKGGLICLVGPPGTGKTSIALSIAKSVNRKAVRISLGGVSDEAEIRGHRKTYIGAMPGRIVNGLIQAKTMNPLMILDEIDKLGRDYKGDPSSALLEVLDPEQNSTFRDNYLEFPVDLSDVLFITTANTTHTIPAPLLDRMEVIELDGYTDEEKVQIAKRHLLPKQRTKHGLNSRQMKLADSALRKVINDYTRESGVRQLEREIGALCRKSAAKVAEDTEKSVNISEKNIPDFLGTEKFKRESLSGKHEVGLVHGLAYTGNGGEVLDIEAILCPGTGKIELTGNLGDVMKESCKTAYSFVRANSEAFGIDPDFYKDKDIHIHFPEAAIPKDGPSAGLAITSVLVSVLSGRPVRQDIAMTGEISLRGRVMAIGGLKEKTMAALRSGIVNIIVPEENRGNINDIDPLVREKLSFTYASGVMDVIDTILLKNEQN